MPLNDPVLPVASRPAETFPASLHARLATLASMQDDAQLPPTQPTLPTPPTSPARIPPSFADAASSRQAAGRTRSPSPPAWDRDFVALADSCEQLSPPGSPPCLAQALWTPSPPRAGSPPSPSAPRGRLAAFAPHRPPVRVTSPHTYDDSRRRRDGMAHGDNTTGALRYAKPLGADFAAAHTGHAAHVHAAPVASMHHEAPWLQRLTTGLPLQLVPLVGSLPALINNMRHAQRGVVWWRYFSQLDRLLQLQLKKPAVSPNHDAARLMDAWRGGKARERLAVRMALCEARFNLSFNAVELLSYAVGLVPLVLRILSQGKKATREAGAGTVLPLLLLASGLLHVAQRASWWLAACQVRKAVMDATDLTEEVRDLLLVDASAACRFHGLQLGFWSAFSLGLLAASGALAGAGITPLAGGALVLASMVGARGQRIWAPRRFDVPDSAIWQVDEGVEHAPTLHRIRTFAPPQRQVAALTSLQQQGRQLQQLEAQVLDRHTTPWRAWVLKTLLFFHDGPGVAALLGILSGRWFCGPGHDPSATLLAGYCNFWRTQMLQVDEELHATHIDLLQLDHAGLQATATGAAADGLCALRAESLHAHDALVHEAQRLRSRIAAAEGWLRDPDANNADLWEALQETWRLHHEDPAEPPPEAVRKPAVIAVLLEARKQLEDWRTSLVWGAKLSCLQRAYRAQKGR